MTFTLPGVTIGATTLDVEINTGSSAVDETFDEVVLRREVSLPK